MKLHLGTAVKVQSPHPHDVFVGVANDLVVEVTSSDKPVVQALTLPKGTGTLVTLL